MSSKSKPAPNTYKIYADEIRGLFNYDYLEAEIASIQKWMRKGHERKARKILLKLSKDDIKKVLAKLPECGKLLGKLGETLYE